VGASDDQSIRIIDIFSRNPLRLKLVKELLTKIKLRYLVLVVLFLLAGTFIVLYFQLVKTKNESVDLFYLRTFQKEYLCWKNNCFERDFTIEPLKLDISTPRPVKIIPVPKFGIRKKIISPEYKENKFLEESGVTPIFDYQITKNYIFFVAESGFFFSQSYLLYAFNKKDNTIDTIFGHSGQFYITSIREDEKYLLVTSTMEGRNSYLVNSETKASSNLGLIKTFSWEADNKYQIGIVDFCRTAPLRHIICSVDKSSPELCDPFYWNRINHRSGISNLGEAATGFVYAIPEGWEEKTGYEPYKTLLIKKTLFTDQYYYISGYIDCPDYYFYENLESKPITIDGIEGKYISYSPPQRLASFVPNANSYYEAATVTFVYQDLLYIFNLGYYYNYLNVNSNNNRINTAEWSQALKDFDYFLNSVKIDAKE
jgi:hypothetical protein